MKIKVLIFLSLLLGSFLSTFSQGCIITADKPNTCKNIAVTFNIPSTTSYSSINWDFGDGVISTNVGSLVTHAFDTFGTFKVTVTLYDASNNIKCTGAVMVVVFDNPEASICLTTPSLQCYENNRFCASDCSKPGGDHAPIVNNVWDMGDGTAYANKESLCHSYISSGMHTWILTVTDSNGCHDTAIYRQINITPKLAPRFTISGGSGCPSTTVKFVNVTDSNNKNIEQWWWDFGDGSPIVTSDLAGDSLWTGFFHTYRKDGYFFPKLILKNKYGCIDSFVYDTGVKNIFYWFDIKKSTPDAVCWDGNNVCFAIKPRPKAYYWLWDFNDPASHLLNYNDDEWDPCHEYASPGYYNISLTIYEPDCFRDTTICAFVPVKGPVAVINLPDDLGFPENNHIQGKPIPLSYFHAAASLCMDVDGDGTLPDDVSYVTRSIGTPYKVNNKFRMTGTLLDQVWCNGELDSSNFTITYKSNYCSGLTPPVINMQMPFKSGTGNTIQLWDSIIETPGTWTPGNPLPAGFLNNEIFFPSSGTVNMHTMHDTDLATPNGSGQNYVRFSNNSIKNRLYYAIDDDPSNYVYPGNDLRFDTCRNPSYPWASDSMNYFWDFGEGQACTSTVSKPNIYCRYSTEIQPWHFYEKNGCYTAKLEVYDPITNCSSTDEVNIVMEKPDAGWDESVFSTLDYLTQKATPEGTGRRGVILEGVPCTGQSYPQTPDLSETLPSCSRQAWWMVFDSAASGLGGCQATGCSDVTYIDTDGDGIKESKETHQNYNCGWVSETLFAMIGSQWIYSNGGWKTIGLIIKSGDCYDTFFYHNYKYIFDVDPSFNIHDPYNYSNGTYALMDYANDQHLTLCSPHQAIITVADQSQMGISRFEVQISPYYYPPWVDPTSLKDTFTLTTKDTFFNVCNINNYSIDPFTGAKVYEDCFLYPNLPKGEKFDRSHYNVLATQGWFAKDTFQQLSLTDTLYLHDATASSSGRIQAEHSLSSPGIYYITSIAKNIYGCYNMSRVKVSVGHYSDFEADKKIVCYKSGGDTVNFTHYIRYFNDRSSPYDPELNQTAFWEDPLVLRGGNFPVTGILEKVEFDCDGDGIYETSGINGTDQVSFVYNMPGDYNVSMRTTDSNGCQQVCEQKAYIKVIGVVAGFSDTNSNKPYICDQLIGLKDQSYSLNKYHYTYNPDGSVKDSNIIDSVVQWKWEFGDDQGTSSISYMQNPVHTFMPGTYDISLAVMTANGCADTISKASYINVLGPKPKFWIWKNGAITTKTTIYETDTVFVIDSSENMSRWIFYKDAVSEQVSFYSRPANRLFPIQYNHEGEYTLTLHANENVYNPSSGDSIPCTEIYGDTSLNPKHPHFTVVVQKVSSFFEENSLNKHIQIFPNPTNDLITISNKNSIPVKSIKVFDILGEEILQIKEKNLKQNELQIDLGPYERGIYMIRIENEQDIYVEKVFLIK